MYDMRYIFLIRCYVNNGALESFSLRGGKRNKKQKKKKTNQIKQVARKNERKNEFQVWCVYFSLLFTTPRLLFGNEWVMRGYNKNNRESGYMNLIIIIR